MSPAHFKTLRESLGLPLDWVAVQCGVSPRSAQYWESGKRTIPQDAIDLLESLESRYSQAMAISLDQYRQVRAQIKPEDTLTVALLRYRTDEDLWQHKPDLRPIPASSHASMLMRLVGELREYSINAQILWFDPAEYFEWLGSRVDSSAFRSLWAAEQLTQSSL